MGKIENKSGFFRNVMNSMNSSSSDNPLTSSLLVMVRWVSLIVLVYNTFMGLALIIAGMKIYGLILLASALVLVLVMRLTFGSNAEMPIGIMALDILISTAIVTRGFGWRCSFQNMIYIVAMIIWYDQNIKLWRKFFYSGFLTACVCGISAFTPFGATVLDTGTFEYSVLVYSNIILFSICFSFVAYFFCEKYAIAAHKLQEYNQELRKMADLDPLTKLMNRRSVTEDLNALIKNYRNNGNPVSISIGDIDLFKKINDTYGHDCGDYVLKEISEMFVKFMEGKGIVGRWGGEEFLFIFSQMNGDDAFNELENLREQIECRDLCFNAHHIKITMTFGLEEFCIQDGIEDTIKGADEKLYLGKESGRNKVVY